MGKAKWKLIFINIFIVYIFTKEVKIIEAYIDKLYQFLIAPAWIK